MGSRGFCASQRTCRRVSSRGCPARRRRFFDTSPVVGLRTASRQAVAGALCRAAPFATLRPMTAVFSSALQDAFSGRRCYVIAEAGSNHCCDRDIAMSLIDVAADAGADAVKFQVFTAAGLYPPSAGTADYLETDKSIEDIVRDIQLPHEWIPDLAAHARSRALDFLATPFDESAVSELDPYVPAFKIASYEITHEPLLRAVAMTRKPVILSTGASTLEEVRRAVSVLHDAGTKDVAVLQCTACYPAPAAVLNLGAITTLNSALAVPVGFSDHSRDPLLAPIAAVALGAKVIEKHFTLSNLLPGPDHRFALEPRELAAMVTAIRATEQSAGNGLKEVLPQEEELRRFARRSIFATRDIAPGEKYSSDNLAILRTGKLVPGLSPSDWARVLSTTSSNGVRRHTALTSRDLA